MGGDPRDEGHDVTRDVTIWRDHDGDLWERDGRGGWFCATHPAMRRTLAELRDEFGPLTLARWYES